MSWNWNSDAERNVSSGPSLASPGADATPSLATPDLPLPSPAPEGRAEAHKPSWSSAKRIAAVGLALVVVAAIGVVVTLNARADGVKAAFASVFSSRSVKVVFSVHSTNPMAQAVAGRYSVVVTLTSESGNEPLSASGAHQAYEISILRGGVDLGDVIVDRTAAYGRVNLQAFEPNTYKSATQSLRNVPAGAERDLVSALVRDKWVGIKDSTIISLAKSLGHNTAPRVSGVNAENLRNAFTLSFAQSWDAWTSIRQLSSVNGVTEYSVKLPVRHFGSTFVSDIRGAVLKDLPSTDMTIARRELSAAAAAIGRIPAGLDIPITLSVTNGSLSRLVISHAGSSLDLAISHPAVGVTAPTGAVMVTTSMIRSGFGGFLRSGSGSIVTSPYIPMPPGSISIGAGNSGVSGTSGIRSSDSGTSGVSGTWSGSETAGGSSAG